MPICIVRWQLRSIKSIATHLESSRRGPAAGRGRGRGRGIMLEEMRKETLKAKQWEVKRRENVQREEQERKQRSKASSSMSRFLADDNRVDMSRTRGRNEHSWGGANFNKVVSRVQREKDGRNRGNIEMALSGKERQQYSQWREERMKIDEERKTRQKMSGNWSRAWDQKKIWDSRRKMWVEDKADDYNHDKSTRWQESDNSEDWGSDNRNSRRDNRSHGKGEQGSRQRFVQHDNRQTEASEEWGETNEVESKVPGSKTDTDTILHHQHDAVSGVGLGEDWDEEIPATVDSQESSNIAKEVTSVPSHSDAPQPPKELKKDDCVVNNQHNNSIDSHNVQESVTEVTRDPSHSDAPKPQRELKQRRQLKDSGVNDELSNNKDSHNDDISPSDEKDLREATPDSKQSTIADKDQDKHLQVESQAAGDDDPENVDGDGNNTNVQEASVSTTDMDDKQDTTNLTHFIERIDIKNNESQGTVKSKSSRAEKVIKLPKLVTKVDKKVSFDTEENDHKKTQKQRMMMIHCVFLLRLISLNLIRV
ncbi:protein of unknown function (DUF4594) [Desmophyllum pertusum]|uniref:Uncharacterized protein n=1 Tax=Desmophyllum pertusum TaxID=174260 RepID=A0A9W9YIX7_9CNID|nr:protein of unknown function (DUF4594) [Desmophyllum pertusum]